MKVIFLVLTSLSMIVTVHAQRSSSKFTCQLSHKHSETAFNLNLNETKDVEVGGWKIKAGIQRTGDLIEVSLKRVVNILDATYQREAKNSLPKNAKVLPVDLHHTFGGRTDVFNMVCYPRDL